MNPDLETAPAQVNDEKSKCGKADVEDKEKVICIESKRDAQINGAATDDNDDEAKSIISPELDQLCKLIDKDMDIEFKDEVWELFSKVNSSCVLTGKNLSWLAVAVFAHQMILKRKDRANYSFRYPISAILKCSKISVIEFFDRLTRFSEVLDVSKSPRILSQCHHLHNSLAISTVIFKKYLSIFRYVFPYSNFQDECNCEASDVFTLIWLLFLISRDSFSMSQSEDLTSCFYSLLCCVDCVMYDLYMCGYYRVIFEEIWDHLCYGGEASLTHLCQTFRATSLSVKHLKAHWFETNVLTRLGIHATANFGLSMKTYLTLFNNMYETQISTNGCFDERNFIPTEFEYVYDERCDTALIEVVRRAVMPKTLADLNEQDIFDDTDLLARIATQACLERVDKRRSTKLSGQAYRLASDQYSPMMLHEQPRLTVEQMERLVSTRWDAVDSNLRKCFAEYRDDPFPQILEFVEKLGSNLVTRLKKEVLEGEEEPEMSAEALKDAVLKLFFHFLEKIVHFERVRTPMYQMREIDFTAVVQKEEFLVSLFAAVLELMLTALNSPRRFPWSLQFVQLPPLNFYKVIEVLIRSEPAMPREAVRHLNRIEERVIEELAWTLESPLWRLLTSRTDSVPSCQRVWVSDQRTELYSPAKRVRFEADSQTSIPVTMFFRKVYYIASVRLQELCERLKLDDRARSLVWTLTEHLVQSETAMLAGRHLDQNLLCCLYLTCRSLKLNVKFNEIIALYNLQPQSTHEVTHYVYSEKEHVLSPGKETVDENGELDNVEVVVSYMNVIDYYNKVFVHRMRSFVEQILNDGEQSMIQLPVLRPFALTPNKIIIGHRISVLSLAPSITVSSAKSTSAGVGSGVRRPPALTSSDDSTIQTRRFYTSGVTFTAVPPPRPQFSATPQASAAPAATHHQLNRKPTEEFY